MDLLDETRDAPDYALMPIQVRAALVEFWDDNESERVNIDLICHWLSVAKQKSWGDFLADSRLQTAGEGKRHQ